MKESDGDLAASPVTTPLVGTTASSDAEHFAPPPTSTDKLRDFYHRTLTALTNVVRPATTQTHAEEEPADSGDQSGVPLSILVDSVQNRGMLPRCVTSAQDQNATQQLMMDGIFIQCERGTSLRDRTEDLWEGFQEFRAFEWDENLRCGHLTYDKYMEYCPFKVHTSRVWCNAAVHQRPADWHCRCSGASTAPHKPTAPAKTELRTRIVQNMLETFLQDDNKSKFNDQNLNDSHLLDRAIFAGDLKTIQALIDAGTNIENVSNSDETVLHLAAKYKQEEVLKYFLEKCNIQNSLDENGLAPIHYTAEKGAVESMILLIQKFGEAQLLLKINGGRTVWHQIAENFQFEKNQHFLQTMDRECLFEGINLVDDDGLPPVMLACRDNHKALTGLFLRHGAALSVDGAKEIIVDAISKIFCNPLKFFEDLFDDCIHTEEDYYVFVNYEVLTDDTTASQMQVIEELVDYGHSTLLQHPMIESLICLKWKSLLHLFYAIVGVYVVFLGSFHIFVINEFSKIDTFNTTDEALNNNTTANVESCGWQNWTLIAIIYTSISVLFVQECFWMYLRKVRYFLYPESWVRLVGLVLAGVVPATLGCSPPPDSLSWQRHVVCAAMLMVWLQAMLLLSRFPGWGFYAFGTVALNLLKIFAKSVCIIIGFATCFMILYKSKPPFDGPLSAIIKTLVMMSSEFDYEDLFDDSHGGELAEYTKLVIRLLFVVFVIFIAIVLMNFMIGVAVSDINELNEIGNIRRLEKQVELLSNLERLNEELEKCWMRFSTIKFQRFMCIMANNPNIPYYVRHTYECHESCCRPTFSSKLSNAIFKIAKKRKQNLHTLDELRDTMVGVLHHPKCPDEGRQMSSATTLNTINDRMISMEESIHEIKSDLNKLLKTALLRSRTGIRNGYRSKNLEKAAKSPSIDLQELTERVSSMTGVYDLF